MTPRTLQSPPVTSVDRLLHLSSLAGSKQCLNAPGWGDFQEGEGLLAVSPRLFFLDPLNPIGYSQTCKCPSPSFLLDLELFMSKGPGLG